MWFRNLRLYRLPSTQKLDLSTLEEKLAARPLPRCGSFEMASKGWTCPRHEGSFVHHVNRQWLLSMGVEQKLLPAAVIRQLAQDRAAEIESSEGRKLNRKEMRDLNERAAEELMPKAFTSRRTTLGWISPEQGLLGVDAGSDARADEFMETLLSTLEGLSLAPRPIQTQLSPITAMTNWLTEAEAPAGFSIDSDLELRAASESQAAIRYVHHDVHGPEVVKHISDGKIVTKLGLTWNDKLSFHLTDRLHIKRLGFLDVLKEQSEQTASNEEERLDADFVLMTGELELFCRDLLAALGGEKPADA